MKDTSCTHRRKDGNERLLGSGFCITALILALLLATTASAQQGREDTLQPSTDRQAVRSFDSEAVEAVQAQQKRPAHMSAAEARKALNETVSYAKVEHEGTALMHWYEVVPGSVEVKDGELSMEIAHKNDKKTIRRDLRQLGACTSECTKYVCYVKSSNEPHARKFFEPSPRLFDSDQVDYRMVFGLNFNHDLCSKKNIDREACLASAQKFLDAVNALRAIASGQGYDPDTFPQKAAAWRALAVKPELSREVRVRRALAEKAIDAHRPNEALKYYEEGTALDVTWAQGWFNAALVAGQLGHYSDAALYMGNYLELAPDAPDADSARDQMAVWKYKAQTK